MHLPERQALADRLRPELGQDLALRPYLWAERVTVVFDDAVQLLGECGGFGVGKVKVRHCPDMGLRSALMNRPTRSMKIGPSEVVQGLS
jgi:hypothetical protein